MKNGKRKRRQRQEEGKEKTASEATKKRKKRSDRGDSSTGDGVRESQMESSCLVFQDAMSSCFDDNAAEIADETEVSNAFFELANSPLVGFRIDTDTKIKDDVQSPCIVVQQNIGTTAHTGGIVWETAYLLLQYLLSTNAKLGGTLEVGAGCGLLGQVLAAAKAADEVVMTEHDIVMQTGHLVANVERNHDILRLGAPVHVHNLDWENYERDTSMGKHLKPHSYDTIVGTDVVFATKLVEPLWKTLQYMSHSKTNIYLCLQVRCEASHKLLLEKAHAFQFKMQDITNQLDSIPSCKWGQALECRLFHITRIES